MNVVLRHNAPRSSLWVWLTGLVLVCLSGCHAPEFSFTPQDSSPEPAEAQPLRQVRVQVRSYHGPAKERHKAILAALQGRGHSLSFGTRSGTAALASAASVANAGSASEAPLSSAASPHPGERGAEEPRPGTKGPPEYVLQVGLRVVGRPRGLRNFAVTWVFGSMFGAPGWAGMGYDYEAATEIRVSRFGDEDPFFTTTLIDTHELIYTSDEYAWLIYFWDLGCLSGIVSTWDELADESELAPVESAFFADEVLSEAYLRRVTNSFERALAADPQE